jgi:hypothetical protein
VPRKTDSTEPEATPAQPQRRLCFYCGGEEEKKAACPHCYFTGITANDLTAEEVAKGKAKLEATAKSQSEA